MPAQGSEKELQLRPSTATALCRPGSLFAIARHAQRLD
jgi:hypothetical protein